MKPITRNRGFHLVELMVALVLLALLLFLALPAYQPYFLRSERSDAVRQLMEAVQCLEAGRALTGAYDTAQCGSALGNRSYQFSIEPVAVTDSQVYRLSAVPVNDAVDAICGTLSIDQFGTRRVSDENANVWDCWGGR